MMDDSTDATSEDLLYDILVYREWPQSQDHRSFSISETDAVTPNRASWSSYLSIWPAAAKVAGIYDPPQEVMKLIHSSPAWKFSLSPDATLLAVLQENLFEFFSSRDNFSVSIAKVRMIRDRQPYLRLIEWSPDSSLLVVTSSVGAVDLYDAYGFLVYSVFSQRLPQNEAVNEEFGGIQSKGYAYAGAFFTNCRVKSREWLYELILVDYRGTVNSFLLSPSGYQEFSSMRLTSHYKYGVSAVSFSNHHNLLCVAGPIQTQQQSNNKDATKGPSAFGLSVWRLLSEAPHYQRVEPHDAPDIKSIRWFRQLSYSRSVEQDHISKLEESPNGEYLSALHISGSISIWRLPGLHQLTLWPLLEQPCHDDMNPSLMQNPRLKKRKKQFLNQPLKWHALDVKWWDEQSLVIARLSGGVTIVPLNNLDKNMLGDSAEFFAGTSHLSKCFGKGFFVLEREITDRRQKSRSEGTEEDDSFDRMRSNQSESSDEEDDEEASLLIKGKRLATHAAYLVTESERFAPPRKRPRLTYHNYKLLALLSTTPEELFGRKIEMEEYGEALILAQHYNLDSDQVYERQWKLSNMSTTAISDYFTKIKRRSLVLRECLNTVPSDEAAIQKLLEYGLQETDLHVLDLLERDENEGRLVKMNRAWHNSATDAYLSEEEQAERKEAEEQQLISRISWDNLTVSQKELLAQRHTLLKYLDRLEAYMDIVFSCQRNDPDFYFSTAFYVKFRDQPILKAAVEFAHEGKTCAVATLLERYPNELEEYKLCILSNFPESLVPEDYADLIPSTDDLLGPYSTTVVTKDWIHYEFIKAKVPEHALVDNEESQIPFGKYRAKVLTRELLTGWIHQRARDIEKESSLVDHSLALLQYASTYCGITVDRRLHHQLTTLEVMLYDMQVPCDMEMLASMSDLEVLVKLMGATSKETIIVNVRKCLVPYLDRLEELETGARKDLLQNYLLHCSATSLVLPFEVIKHSSAAAEAVELAGTKGSSAAAQPAMFMSLDECVNIGLDCIYSYESDEESELIVEMAQFLKKKCTASRNQHVREEIDDILDIMKAIRLLKRYNIVKTLHYFKACRNDVKAMEDLFVQLTRRAEGKKPRLSPREWSEVLQDVFELRRFIPVVSVHLCLEIFCESLLSSEVDENINLVRDIFDYKPADALFKATKSATLYVLSVHKIGNVPLASKEKIVSKTCEYYLDSSKDVDDTHLELAKRCLGLMPEAASEHLQAYRDMLTALDMLAEFGVSILPIVVRHMTHYVPLVQKILHVDPTAYKSARKIIRMIKLLGGLERSRRPPLDEAPILFAVAEYALKALDFDYCLSICDLMMEKPSREACQVSLRLINSQDFADHAAKVRLTSFCVNYCDERDIEDMLMQRINWVDEAGTAAGESKTMATAVTAAVVTPTEGEEEEEAFSSEGATAAMKSVLSKITETESLIPAVIPDGSKVISSLFGKLSKFAVQAPAEEDDEDSGWTGASEDVLTDRLLESPRKKERCVSTNVFYEDVFPHGIRLGQLHSSLESYAAAISNGPIDGATLSLVSRHYRNGFQCTDDDQEFEGIDPDILQDILLVILSEDTALGLSLLLAHNQHSSDMFKSTPGLGLYLASIRAALQQSANDVFRIPPGLLYCWCKTLMYQNKLGDELFAKVLKDVETS